MGNSIGKVGVCFTGPISAHDKAHKLCMSPNSPYYDEGLGHSFCYLRPDPARLQLTGPGPGPTSSSKIHSEESTAQSSSIFRSISGASVSANTSTPLSTAFVDPAAATFSAAFFESSTSFASVPLQPIPRSGPMSGPITYGPELGYASGPMDRAGGFMSGPLERAGPVFSGPLDRSFSVHGGGGGRGWSKFGQRRRRSGSIISGLRRAISKTFNNTVGVLKDGLPNMRISTSSTSADNHINNNNNTAAVGVLRDGPSIKMSLEESEELWESENLQWAQGKAGEDRVHVVVSEERGWVFVGIYDGFNGPDATDFLLSNLYVYVQKELKGLLWDDHSKSDDYSSSTVINSCCSSTESSGTSSSCSSNSSGDRISSCLDFESCASSSSGGGVSGCEGEPQFNSCGGKKGRGKFKGVNKKWEENHRRWKCEWDRERVELDKRLKEQWNRNGGGVDGKMVNHSDVLEALSRALRKTEEAYLDIADKMLDENPELALMGSCVLAMLMKGEDVYVMNVGDSRAVLGQNKEPDLGIGKVDQDLERINEESMYDFDVSDGVRCNLRALQLSVDHSTSIEEEVQRIRDEHPDDASSVMNDRVKGSLKVTRAFGAGFLKQKKWNDALLEMFQIDYIGNSSYINCLPFLYHHRLGPKDQFLILSSDGLYQYFTNEEAVSEVEHFISLSPEGDPAQHLVEEVLFRAAKRAGLDFYELLEIPQGDRRRYHDDVSIIVISFEGRIWRSCV